LGQSFGTVQLRNIKSIVEQPISHLKFDLFGRKHNIAAAALYGLGK
jgi:hypothetical protein